MYGKIHDLKCSSLANYFKKCTLEFNYTRFKQTIPLTSNNTLFKSVILPLKWLQWNLRERDTLGNRRPYNPNTSLFPIYKNYSLSRLVITVSTIGIYSGVATTGPIRAANFWRTLFKLSLWTMLFANELRMYNWVELYHEPTNYWGATRWAFIHHQTRCC